MHFCPALIRLNCEESFGIKRSIIEIISPSLGVILPKRYITLSDDIMCCKHIHHSITDENQLLAYIKKNFSIFISLFKNGGLNDINKTKNEKELDEKFMKMFGLNNNISNYLDNINKNNQKVDDKMDIEEDETNNNNNINNIDYSNEIKIVM